jgi:Rod binding domain-containing protein
MDGIEPLANYGLQIADWSRLANPPSDNSAAGGRLVPDAAAASGNPQSTAVDRADQKKQQIAKDFESVLLTRLFEQVQKTIGSLDTEEDGTAQQVQGLFWLYLARDAADKGGVGLWKDIYQQLQQMDGVPNPADVLDEEL